MCVLWSDLCEISSIHVFPALAPFFDQIRGWMWPARAIDILDTHFNYLSVTTCDYY